MDSGPFDNIISSNTVVPVNAISPITTAHPAGFKSVLSSAAAASFLASMLLVRHMSVCMPDSKPKQAPVSEVISVHQHNYRVLFPIIPVVLYAFLDS